jgi:hypothetical protein
MAAADVAKAGRIAQAALNSSVARRIPRLGRALADKELMARSRSRQRVTSYVANPF